MSMVNHSPEDLWAASGLSRRLADPARLEAVRLLTGTDHTHLAALDDLVCIVRDAVGCDGAAFSLFDRDQVITQAIAPGELEAVAIHPLPDTVVPYVLERSSDWRCEDTSPLSGVPEAYGVTAMAGVVVHVLDGLPVGVLFATHATRRSWHDTDMAVLKRVARAVARELEHLLSQRQDKEALEVMTGRLTSMVDHLDAAVLVETEDRHIHYVNQTFCDLFRIPAPAHVLLGVDCSEAAEQSRHLFKDPDGFSNRMEEILAAREAVRHELVDMADDRLLERSYVPILVGGRYRGHMWTYRDVTGRERLRRELERRAEELQALSESDTLTALRNRRGFEALARGALEGCRLAGYGSVVLFFDMDGLKKINDELGHRHGDRALVAFSRILLDCYRATDVVGRLGGDEFVVLAPRCGLTQAQASVVRLRRRLSAFNATNSEAWTLSTSVGMSLDDGTSSIEDLLLRSDEAMYRDKERRKAGRAA